MIAGHLSGHPHIAIDKPAFFPKISSARHAPASNRQAQVLQTHRTTVRENRAGSFVALAFGFILVKSPHGRTNNECSARYCKKRIVHTGGHSHCQINRSCQKNKWPREGCLRAALPQVQPPFAVPKRPRRRPAVPGSYSHQSPQNLKRWRRQRSYC